MSIALAMLLTWACTFKLALTEAMPCTVYHIYYDIAYGICYVIEKVQMP